MLAKLHGKVHRGGQELINKHGSSCRGSAREVNEAIKMEEATSEIGERGISCRLMFQSAAHDVNQFNVNKLN